MRSIAEQTDQELGGRGSLLVRQRRDHTRLGALLDEVERRGAEEETLSRLWRLVFPHAYAEETVVWPVIRRVLHDGEALTLRVEQEHQEINALAARIDQLSAGVERNALIGGVVALLRQDARDEEDLLLPRLQEQLTPVQLRRLGRTWELVRRTAPTRPHAVVSRRPPGNLLAAAPLTVLDRTRDGLDRTARRAPATALVLRPTSRGLAAIAGVVEQLPALRRGERPSTSVRS
jgi:hypothetical protein